MTIQEIRESGLLELYVLGELGASDRSEVDAALATFPELKADIKAIEQAFEVYAEAHAVQPPTHILNKVLDEVKSGPSKGGSSGFGSKLMWIIPVALLALAVGSYLSYAKQKQENSALQLDIARCEDERNVQQQEIALWNNIEDVNNQIVRADATDKYPQTQIYFHHNPVSQRNFIQVQNLPPINENQSYQLWSLIGDQAPIPLNVFQGDEGILFEVDHVQGTNAYAITIEPRGGQQAPTLEDLIGVIPIG